MTLEQITALAVKGESETLEFAVRVSQGSARPYQYRGTAYRRVGNTTVAMSADEYNRILFERMHSEQRWENQPATGWSVDAAGLGWCGDRRMPQAPRLPHARCARPKVLGCGTRWDKAGRMRDKPLWLLWFLRGAAACPPAAAAHRQVPLATPQACRLARRYAPDRRQRDRRTEARLAREPVSVVRVWAAPCGAVVLSSGPYAPESRHPAYPGRSRDQNF